MSSLPEIQGFQKEQDVLAISWRDRKRGSSQWCLLSLAHSLLEEPPDQLFTYCSELNADTDPEEKLKIVSEEQQCATSVASMATYEATPIETRPDGTKDRRRLGGRWLRCDNRELASTSRSCLAKQFHQGVFRPGLRVKITWAP
jgi:hypothetical protein